MRTIIILISCVFLASACTTKRQVVINKDDGGNIKVWADKAKNHYIRAEFEEALKYFHLVDEKWKSLPTSAMMGECYYRLGKMSEAELHFDQALRYEKDLDDFMKRYFYARASHVKAKILYAREEYDLSFVYYQKAIDNSTPEKSLAIFLEMNMLKVKHRNSEVKQ